MNLFLLSWKNIWARPLGSVLSILLFGFGVSIIVVILLSSALLKNEINKNAKGIDLVVGAKGSPLQIILSSIFHVDFPTGNISLRDADHLTKNRLVASAIPLSLGDSYQGYRIVGTTPKYAEWYQAELEIGRWFDQEMTATIGSQVAKALYLSVGDKLESAHGLAKGGRGHEDHPFTVVGILKPMGSVMDRLILVSVPSIWEVHHSEAHEHDTDDEVHDLVVLDKLDLSVTNEQLLNRELTSLLIKYRSPIAAVQLPGMVNRTSNLQAASPPYEIARLFNLMETGIKVVNILGVIIISISAISVFISLINSLKERKYELAIMRSMGASRLKVFVLILMEGFVLTMLGSTMGFMVAHIGIHLMDAALEPFRINGLFFLKTEYIVVVGSILVGIFASIIPASMAYRTDISETLAKA